MVKGKMENREGREGKKGGGKGGSKGNLVVIRQVLRILRVRVVSIEGILGFIRGGRIIVEFLHSLVAARFRKELGFEFDQFTDGEGNQLGNANANFRRSAHQEQFLQQTATTDGFNEPNTSRDVSRIFILQLLNEFLENDALLGVR